MRCPEFSFEVVAQHGKARAGIIHTPRGDILTPVFMPVGTAGTVKGMTMTELEQPPIDAQIILGNTYHLYLQPGTSVIDLFNGLHNFSGWKRPILTDSGGYQVFSLSGLNKIDDDGVTFQSHIDGSKHHITPEKSLEIQASLGSDIAMAFDQCPALDQGQAFVEDAMRRTTLWAERCASYQRPSKQALFGIIQGGVDLSLRKKHLEEITAFDFDGYAIGGLSVGEPKESMYEVLDGFVTHLPEKQPRYLMGVGTPEDIKHAVLAGVDMFDCVMPTRNARNGQLFTAQGRMVISNAQYRDDIRPVEEDCSCLACQTVSRAYLRHLYKNREVLYVRLATQHNLAFYARTMKAIREDILLSSS